MLSAYSLPPPTSIEKLTLVRRDTPMGELLRRYWHPIGLTSDASATPRLVRALGEDLILFRDGQGRPGLLHPRCAHRGASLLYGKTEEAGIRCCYHGWLFDVNGACLEQPCEPNRGARTASRVRQPGYPVQELYGLIFAYLGPPEHQPLLPRYDVLENLAPGELIEADDSSIGSGGPAIVPCNWLQHFENVVDPFHVPILHGSFSGNQFIARMALMPTVRFEETERGIRSTQVRSLDDKLEHRRVTEAVLPTVRAVANPRAEKDGACTLLGWVLPIDDTSFRIYSAGRVTEQGSLGKIRSHFNGKLWHELSPEEHRDFPGDYEAQVGQGAITAHSEEHLVWSDRGVGMLRRLYRKQLDLLAAGKAPMGTRFGNADPLVHLEAGTLVVEKEHAQGG
jgi:phenylpropionate dioxygenase-like ring-hydroxylating dioxygenase large terminal subunit